MFHVPSLSDSRAEPVPYELYIRLHPLVASWSAERDRWPGAVVAASGFQAAELTLRLIGDALGDTRPAAAPPRRISRYAEHLVDGLELTCRLLRKFPAPRPDTVTGSGDLRRPPPSPGFSILARLDLDQVDRITGRFALAAAGLDFGIGIEEQLRDIRRQHGLATADPAERQHGLATADPAGSGRSTPVMDYHVVVGPDRVFGLREPAPCGPEDHLFSTAHQITECWLSIAHHYLEEARVLAEQRRWDAASDAMANACQALPLATQAGQLLDLMVLADYHPLRVRLRDGSGAQSRAAQRLVPTIRSAARPLWTALDIDDLTILDVLDQPTAHLGLYRYLSTLKTVGKRIQGFLFDHYLLALGVLGTQSLGSAGYEISKLAERAAQPLFPEINQTHHDYVMLTNFQYGDSSGAIVYNNELAEGWNPYAVVAPTAGCPRELVEERIAAYFRHISERNVEAWVKLFDPVHGQLHDVLGTRPYLGQARLRVYVNGVFNAFREIHGTHAEPRINGNNASLDWHIDGVSYHGIPTAFDGREDFVFDDEGRIVNAVAHWKPSEVARKWRAHAAAGRKRTR